MLTGQRTVKKISDQRANYHYIHVLHLCWMLFRLKKYHTIWGLLKANYITLRYMYVTYDLNQCDYIQNLKKCWQGKEQLKNQRSTSKLSLHICVTFMLNAVWFEKKSYSLRSIKGELRYMYVTYDLNQCDYIQIVELSILIV